MSEHPEAETLTAHIQQITLNTLDLLIRTINQLNHRRNSILVSAVNLEKHALEGAALQSLCVTVSSAVRRSAQELANSEQLLTKNLCICFRDIGDGICAHSLQLLLVCLLQGSLLAHQSLLVLVSDLLIVCNLFFNLRNAGLEGGFLQGLRLLIVVNLLLFDQLVERFALVLGEDGVNLGGSILESTRKSERLVIWDGTRSQSKL
jgi:hypothetical protein